MRPHADDTSPAWRPPPLYPAELAITDGLKQLAVCGLPTAYRANRIDGHGLVPDSDGDHLEMVDSESSPLRASPDMLFEFARLADASSAEILAYVQKWGRLGLCDHARPSSAHLNCLTAEVEPIAAWRRYAAGFRSLLLLLTALDDNRPAPTETDWAAIEWVVPAAAHTILLLAEARYPGHERGLTASVLDALHTEAGIGTLVVWPTSASRPKLVFAIGHRSLVGTSIPPSRVRRSTTGLMFWQLCSSARPRDQRAPSTSARSAGIRSRVIEGRAVIDGAIARRVGPLPNARGTATT